MAEYTEEEYEQSQSATPIDPPKGSEDWAEQNSGGNAPELKPTPNPAPGTVEAHEQQQGSPTTTSVSAVGTSSPQPQEEQPAVSTDTEHETPAVSHKQQQRVDATAGTDRQIKTIQDWMDAEGNRPETEEERTKRERREKSKRIIAAVSDGISALSNLYFTSQYAPNMYNHEKGSATNAVDARIERLKAEREKKRDRYMNFSLKLGDLENERAKTMRELEEQQERRKLAREKAKREADQHNWLALLQPDKQREQAGKAKKAEQEAITAQAEAEAAPEMQNLKLATERARKSNFDASAAAHNRSNGKEYSAWDEHGKEHKFHSKDAAERYAKQHGTWKELDEVSTSEVSGKDAEGYSYNRNTKTTKKGGYPDKPSFIMPGVSTMPGVK